MKLCAASSALGKIRISGEDDILRTATCLEDEFVGELHDCILRTLDGYEVSGPLKLSIQSTGLEFLSHVLTGCVLRDYDRVLAVSQCKCCRVDSGSIESQDYCDSDEVEDEVREVSDVYSHDEFCQ